MQSQSRPSESNTEPTALTLAVEGMSCGHCKLAITEEVTGVAGVESVDIDLDTKVVRVRGTDVDGSALVSAMDEAGLRGDGGMSASTRHFVRHYVEMVVAMLLGMAVLGLPALAALGVVGVSWSDLQNDAPALLLLGMGVTMTVPMVAWMRYRGHGWPACADMIAAMFIPTFGVIALLWSGLVDDIGTLLDIEHLVMFPSMLVAMLLRRDEYTRGVRDHGRHQVTA